MLIVGVDLGSTLCRTAVARGPRAQPIPNRFSERRLPFVVEPPEEGQGEPESLHRFSSLKQHLGLSELVSIANQTRRVSEDVTDIFKQLHEDVSSGVGEDVVGCVLTVPGCFSERQRNALRDAAIGGGFNPVRLLDDAVAAVLARREAILSKREVLVYALGAGVFTVTVMSLNDGPRVLSSEGDRTLGGYSFDAALVEGFLEQVGLDAAQLRESEDLVRRLRDLAEQVRLGLSRRLAEEFDAPLSWPGHDGAGGVQSLTMTREAFERQILDSVEETLELSHRALAEAGVEPRKVGGILLVGGAARTPLIESRLHAEFGVDVIRAGDHDPARGAALYGLQITEELEQQRKARAAAPTRVGEPAPSSAPSEPAQRVEVGAAAVGWLRSFAPWMTRAENLWSAGEQSAAIGLMERLYKEDLPRFIGNLYYQRGDACLRERKLHQAAADLELALQYNPDDGFATNSYHRCLNEQSKELLQAGKLQEARTTIREALRIKRDCGGCQSVAEAIEARLRSRHPGGRRAGGKRRRKR